MTRRNENKAKAPAQPRRKNPPRGSRREETAPIAGPPRRPASKIWLESDCPADIDGAVNPPQFYARGLAEKNATRVSYGYPPWAPPPPLQATSTPVTQPPSPPTYAQVVRGAFPLDPRLSVATSGPPPPGPLPPIPVLNVIPPPISVLAPPSTLPLPPAVEPSESSIMVYLKQMLPSQPSKSGKPTSAKAAPPQTRLVTLNVHGPSLTRASFIRTCLAAHHVADEYVVGEHSGPDFKLWYTGSIGGQAGAPTVSTDAEFADIIAALRRKAKAAVGVSFDLDAIEGFRTRKRALLPDASDDEHRGTKAPRLDDFDDTSRMKGHFTIKLQEKWACNTHRGEHGEPGQCYVDAVGNHFGLNNNHFRTWSNALAAGRAMLDSPPDGMVFGGSRDGLTKMVKPRGRVGNTRATTDASSGNGTSEMMNVAMLALLAKVTDAMGPPSSSSSGVAADLSPAPSPSTLPSLPTVDVTSELHACLLDLLPIDFLDVEEVFVLNELTPDLIPTVDDSVLCSMTGAPLGRVMKLKMHCRDWQPRC
ncbi:hypothetical protein EV121DRAFT_281663 [Schizophyllum commune]